MIRHNRKRPNLVMAELSAFEQRVNHKLRDRILLRKVGPVRAASK